MFVEMSCSCGASFQTDSEQQTLAMMWATSFVSAHQACGYMSKPYEEQEERTKRYNITPKERYEDL